MCLIVKAKSDTFTFNNYSRDQFGRWCLVYHRGGTRCSRPIVDENDRVVKERKPTGGEAIEAAERILGRTLLQNEVHGILDLKVIQ